MIRKRTKPSDVTFSFPFFLPLAEIRFATSSSMYPMYPMPRLPTLRSRYVKRESLARSRSGNGSDSPGIEMKSFLLNADDRQK